MVYLVLQQRGYFKGIIVNATNTTANDGGYDIRLSGSEWKLFQANQKKAVMAAKAMKLKVTKDSSGFIDHPILCCTLQSSSSFHGQLQNIWLFSI